MGSIETLASQLSNESLSPAQISRAIRVLGFRSSTRGLKHALLISSALSPQFLRLKQLVNSTPDVFDDFLLSKTVLDLLDKSEISEDWSIDRSRYSPLSKFCSSLIQSSIPLESYKSPNVAEPIAFFWFLNAVMGMAAFKPSTVALVRILNISRNDLPELICYEVAYDFPKLARFKTFIECNSILEFIDNFSPVFVDIACGLVTPNADDTKAALYEVISVLSNRPLQGTNNIPPQNEQENDFEIESLVTAQRGISLSERERLVSHPNAFEEDELQNLASLIRTIIEKDIWAQDPHTYQYYYDKRAGVYPPLYIEAFIVGLALATGRTIADTLQISVSINRPQLAIDSIEHINVDYQKDIGQISLWVRPTKSERSLQLPLPSFLDGPLSSFVASLASSLYEGLPYSTIPWTDRCHKWLEGKVAGSRFEVERKIRDALPRTVYQISASPSLLTHIASPLSKQGNSESLSRYLDPLNERTFKTYEGACTKIFNKYGSQQHAKIRWTYGNTFAISLSEQKRISGHFISQTEEALKSGDLISFHNAIAHYCLMLLVVATAHRKSSTPFYFSWDILAEECLAFLCDKATVGSEARFVPLPTWIVDQITAYRRHLLILSEHISHSNPSLAQEISNLAFGVESGESNNSNDSPAAYLGLFFKLGANCKPTTLTTSDLQRYYESAATKSISSFRKKIADYLWSSGCSGHEVEAFLGHNGSLHAFGESSTWDICSWADRLRPLQEKYLKEAGWRPVEFWKLPARIASKSLPAPLPRLKTSAHSYEGRLRSRNNNRAVARKIICANLPDEWFLNETSTITDEDLDALKEKVRSQLEFNPDAVTQINHELARQINEIRMSIGKVDSPITNLTKTEPGPIEITSSRHVSIAKNLRIWWSATVGIHTKTSSDTDGRLLALSKIGISLVISDAVLDTALLNAYLDAISNHEYHTTKGCILVRTELQLASTIAEKSIILSPHTAALVTGFHKKYATLPPQGEAADDVTKSMNRVLKIASADLGIAPLNISTLIAVFRAWWQLRLPGALHAIATAQYMGPAADLLSETAILENSLLSDPVSAQKCKASQADDLLSLGPKDAIKQLNGLLRKAKGRFENLESHSRLQRSILNDSITKELPNELRSLVKHRQIVSLMVGFLKYLLDNGGPRKPTYAFSSIPTRFSSIRLLINILWDENLYQFEAVDFDKAYRRLLNDSKDKKVDIEIALVLFHRYLRQTIGAPACRIASNMRRFKTRARSAIITDRQFEIAWASIRDLARNDSLLAGFAYSALSLGYGYGLRSKELYGIHSKHLVLGNTVEIYVKRNVARDLKSGASRRFIPCLLPDKDRQKHLKKTIRSAEISQRGGEFIFASPMQPQQLYPTAIIDDIVVTSLRHATANQAAILHTMRHTAATRLAHHAFVSPRAIPLSSLTDLALGKSYDREMFLSIFEGGFSAWPFWLDRAAMIMGHASVDTLLNTYWHSSDYRLAEYTWNASAKDHLTGEQISNMLSQDRSTLSKKRTSLTKQAENDTALINPYEVIVAHYVSHSGIPELSGKPKKSGARSKANVLPIKHDDSLPTRWIDYDGLLCQRLKEDFPLPELELKAPALGFSEDEAKKFMLSYRAVVEATGFDDFEPFSVNSISSRKTRFTGASRGQTTRGVGLATCQELSEKSAGFLDELTQVTLSWIEHVDFRTPWLVAKDLHELNEMLQVLKMIGVESEQIALSLYSVDSSFDRRHLKYPVASVAQSDTRFSKNAKHVLATEFGIKVLQSKGSKIDDGRDFHRLVFVLAVILRAKTM